MLNLRAARPRPRRRSSQSVSNTTEGMAELGPGLWTHRMPEPQRTSHVASGQPLLPAEVEPESHMTLSHGPEHPSPALEPRGSL